MWPFSNCVFDFALRGAGVGGAAAALWDVFKNRSSVRRYTILTISRLGLKIAEAQAKLPTQENFGPFLLFQEQNLKLTFLHLVCGIFAHFSCRGGSSGGRRFFCREGQSWGAS